MEKALPTQYLDYMKNLLEADYADYVESFEEKSLKGVRINQLKINEADFFNLLNNEFEKVKWCHSGYYYEDEMQLSKSNFYNAGLFYLQEPSAMAPASVININENDKVLDICAAPGGKATFLGEKLKGTGVLVANDISTGRCKALAKNLELYGIRNAVVLNESPENLVKKFEGYFDKILIDAPCSGEGMFRRDSSMVSNWNENVNDEYAIMQYNILENASKMLNGQGEILYSTCTFSAKENEEVIKKFLENNENFEIIKISEEYGFENGVEGLSHAKRLFPHKIKGEGHFLALIKNNMPKTEIICKKVEDEKKDISDFYNFKEKYLNIEFNGRMKLHENTLFLIPNEFPDVKGLRVTRSGFHLGDFKNKRFEPSQALAMALKADEAKLKVNFEVDDPRIAKYFKGDSFEVEAEDGFNLICIKNYPIGWGKVKNGRMKNKYNVGWIVK